MEIRNSKPKAESLPDREFQRVEMITYFDNDQGDQSVFHANFDIDLISDLMQMSTRYSKENGDKRKEIQDYILEVTLQSINTIELSSHIMAFLCLYGPVKEELINFPNGGWAVIGNFNYTDPSLLKVSIIHPDELNKQRNADHSIKPFNEEETGIWLSGDSVICNDIEEALFLSSLVELIKNAENNRCHHTNDDLLMMSPVPLRTCEKVAQILGKFKKLGIIGSIIYNSQGKDWYRDLFLKFPVNHILFLNPLKFSA